MTTRYTNKGIREFLIKVINMALTAAGYTGDSKIPVIISNQNTPAPALPYITVGFSGISTRQGEVTKTGPIAYDDEGETKYKQYIIQDNEKVFTLTEEGGNGSLLELVTDSMELESIREQFVLYAISLMRIENVIPRPQLFNEDWQVGATLDLILGVPSGLEEASNYIETVNITRGLDDPE